MLNTPFSPWPAFSAQEVEAVAAVLTSNRVNYWTGTEGRTFESDFARWVGSKHAIALTNGTVALDLALQGLGIGERNGGSAMDEVIVTPRTFIASVSCVINAGARPVFADIDPDSGNITPGTISAQLSPSSRAIVPVHLGGWPCDMPGIMALARLHGLAVIEDCAQAHGARINGASVGTFGDVAAWSFCQDKIMTTGGEGGLVTTDDEMMWHRMWSFKDHGKSWEAVYEREHPPGFRWVHENIGTNWRMLEVQAAIGLVQLRKMAEWTAKRTANAQMIRATLLDFEGAVRVPWPDASMVHACYRLYAYVKSDGLRPGWDRDRIVAEAAARGIPLFQGSCSEVYLEKAFDGTGLRPAERLPNARALGETSLMFLVHPTLTEAEIAKTCEVIRAVLEEAGA